jgi:hypothetical protein
MTKYWIKLYHEILRDPKMARMPDGLWRRTIELFLLAGETGDDGRLPPLSDIAWLLRIEPEILETEMIELQRVGILSVVDGDWIVTKFQERQEPLPKAEYMRRARVTGHKEQYYQPVTISHTDTDIDTDIDTDKINGDGDIPRFENDAQEALHVYTSVTNMLAFPGGSQERDIERICAAVKQYGLNKTIELGKRAWYTWSNSIGKNGRPYSRVNTNWLDWILSGDIPDPNNGKAIVTEMSISEQIKAERRKAGLDG